MIDPAGRPAGSSHFFCSLALLFRYLLFINLFTLGVFDMSFFVSMKLMKLHVERGVVLI